MVTTYFNPGRHRSKLRNFEFFAGKLDLGRLPWFAVECAFGDAPFELPRQENIVQVRARAPLWQKERLLNLVWERLPDRFTKVAWLDADVLFENADWAPRTSELLERFPVVQPYEQAIRLPRGQHAFDGAGAKVEAFAAVLRRDPDAVTSGEYRRHGHTGHAWAARREVFARDGLYDACIAGGGDHLMAHAFAGDWESACLHALLPNSPRHRAHAVAWCERIYPRVRASVASTMGTLLHLWHGGESHRRYEERHFRLAATGFDPERDLRLDASGCWEWAGADATWLDWMRTYFDSRREDE